MPRVQITQDLRNVAKKILLGAGALESRDPRLPYLLGRVCQALHEDDCTLEGFSYALALDPDGEGSSEAWFAMAIAYAHGGDSAGELRAYDHYLRVERSMPRRALALSNRAETEMRLGNPAASVQDYEEALRLGGGGREGEVLSRWGLALTFDRSGDFAKALEQAKLASERDDPNRSYLDSEGVFFVPPYDVLWFKALGATVLALEGKADASSWEQCAARWEAFAQRAARAPEPDPWIPLARAHASYCLDHARSSKALPAAHGASAKRAARKH